MNKILALFVVLWAIVLRLVLLITYIPAMFGWYEPALEVGFQVLWADEKATQLWDS